MPRARAAARTSTSRSTETARRGSPAALVRALEVAARSCRGAEPRKMFGYPALFANGNMFAGLIRASMVLRLSDADRAAFLELPGAKPFVAMKGRVMRQWAVVPPAMTKDGPALTRWLKKAHAYGRSLPPKEKRRR